MLSHRNSLKCYKPLTVVMGQDLEKNMGITFGVWVIVSKE